MEIKNKKIIFAVVLLVLALAGLTVVEAVDLGFRFSQSNVGKYLAGKMIANYLIIFALLFAVVYLFALSKESRPGGAMLALFVIALFAISVALVIFITGGENEFIWDISRLANVRWLFQIKSIVNALIVAAVCLAFKTYGPLKEKGKDRAGMFAAIVIIAVISILIASMVNYAESRPANLPSEIKYEEVDGKTVPKYVDRWIWQYPQVKNIKLFLLGEKEDGTYNHPQTGDQRQGILIGKGLMAFIAGSVLLIWLFVHFKVFGEHKIFKYGTAVYLAALLANQGTSLSDIMSYAWWTILLILNNYFKRQAWGQARPGMAFGLSFAIVQTIYTAVVGVPYLVILGTRSFLWNFVIGIAIGYIWDTVLGKGGILGADVARDQGRRERFAELWRKGQGRRAVGEMLNDLSMGMLGRWQRFRDFFNLTLSLEEQMKPLIEEAESILEQLIAAERAATRNAALISDLRNQFNRKMMQIQSLNTKIRRLRGGP
jgi:hypothetical protein